MNMQSLKSCQSSVLVSNWGLALKSTLKLCSCIINIPYVGFVGKLVSVLGVFGMLKHFAQLVQVNLVSVYLVLNSCMDSYIHWKLLCVCCYYPSTAHHNATNSLHCWTCAQRSSKVWTSRAGIAHVAHLHTALFSTALSFKLQYAIVLPKVNHDTI